MLSRVGSWDLVCLAHIAALLIVIGFLAEFGHRASYFRAIYWLVHWGQKTLRQRSLISQSLQLRSRYLLFGYGDCLRRNDLLLSPLHSLELRASAAGLPKEIGRRQTARSRNVRESASSPKWQRRPRYSGQVTGV